MTVWLQGDAAVQLQMPLRNAADTAKARLTVRRLGEHIGMPDHLVDQFAIAVSEICRNVIDHASGGCVFLEVVAASGREGLAAVVIDRGPGIDDIQRALQDGFSTGAGLGLGLPAARRLAHELTIDSTLGEGTKVTLRQWSS
jgi:serine/threonine-protein kinase RsbT